MTAPLPDLLERLSARTRRFLDLEETSSSGKFAAVASVATGCLRAGLTSDEFEKVVEFSDLGAELYSSGRRKTRGQFLTSISKAWDFADRNFDPYYFDDSRSIREQLEELLLRIRTRPWPGRSANTDRAVSAALVAKALAAGGRGYSVRASTRELAELSGISSMTVSRALPRLRALGLIKSVRANGKGLARTWTLDLAWGETLKGHPDTDGLRIKDAYVTVRPLTTTHEAFIGRGSLGQSSARIWDWLTSNGSAATVAEIRRGTGLGDKTIKRHVPRMVELAMLHREGTRDARYSVTATADLDSVAEQLGSAGWRERAKAQHAQDREWMASPSLQPEWLAESNAYLEKHFPSWLHEWRMRPLDVGLLLRDPFNDPPYPQSPLPGPADPFNSQESLNRT